MSKRNGDRARFQKDRKRRLHLRQRIAALVVTLRTPADEPAPPVARAAKTRKVFRAPRGPAQPPAAG
jgi:hypothetical protein